MPSGPYVSTEIPADLRINHEPRRPEDDPRLGIPVDVEPGPTPPNRLVTIGDSITHGFMSLAIHKTWLSWPALVAYELGLEAGTDFRFPLYEPPGGPGGLPLDLERLARAFESRFGEKLDPFEVPAAVLWLRGYVDGIEDHWERGLGTKIPPPTDPFHNLAVYGYDLLDTLTTTSAVLDAVLAARPARDDLIGELPENDGVRAGRVVLASAKDPAGHPGTVFDAARALGDEGPDGAPGIETLVVALGANCALGSVVSLAARWTTPAFRRLPVVDRQRMKRAADGSDGTPARSAVTVWHPDAFADEWADVVAQARTVNARHVIVATVPSVTIAPIARGVGGKWPEDRRYFEHYTRPWIANDDFTPAGDDHLTAREAQAIDSAIDAYNATIIQSVRVARREGLDWHLFDMGGLLERLAYRRYLRDDQIEAPGDPYDLPPALDALRPPPDTRFFRSGPNGRFEGGLFSLDGVHPSTSGYGVIAHEVMQVMRSVGVDFPDRDGVPTTGIDFARVLAADSLLADPPVAVSGILDLARWLDDTLDWFTGILR